MPKASVSVGFLTARTLRWAGLAVGAAAVIAVAGAVWAIPNKATV